MRHRVSIGASYELPGANLGNRLERSALGGWTLAGTGILQSGTPFTVFSGAAFRAQLINPNAPATPANLQYAPGSGDFNADGNNNDYPSVTGYAQSHKRADYRLGRGIFATCPGGVLPCGNFTLPTFGSLGNEAPNQFRNPGYADFDMTLKKVTPITERFNLELRLDTFNIANRVNYGGVDTNLQDGGFGQSGGTASAARNMLVGARLNF